ncbi:MAG: glycosyltransferase, partial [Candidatus Aminicenantes bacterium]|nr:glycosyltransferase [Candidatus Aminicenantes bacterium]
MAMVQAAQKKCFAEHLYHHRIESILHKVKTTPLPLTPAEGKPKRVRMEKKRILYVSHNLVGVDPFGGVEVYVDLLTKTLPEEYETLIYYPDRKDSSGKRIFLLNVKTSQKTEHTFEREYDASFLLDSERESWFRKILHQERIDLVHFQHMMGHPWSLPLIARSLGIPVLMTIPDYFPVCHRANLTSSEKQYCNIPHLPLVTCDICLQKNYGVIFGSQSSRRTFIAAIFENIDSIIFLSKSEREIVESLFPVLKGAPKVLVEGFPIVDRPFSLELRNNQNKVLTVAVPGNFKITKGADSLCKIFNAMRDEPVEFHIYGANHIRSGTFFSEISQALQGPNIKIHGPYSEDSLHENLLKADVSLLLSVWPETYVLTLSESWRAGVVPIVTDIGALGERVEDRVNGLKVPVDQPGSVVQLLREFIADRNELKRMRKN